MAIFNMKDYEIVSQSNNSKPLNMDDYEIVDQKSLKQKNLPSLNQSKFDPFGSIYNSLQTGAGEFNTGLAKLIESPVNLGVNAINLINPKANLQEWHPLSDYTQSMAQPYQEKTQELSQNPANQPYQLVGQMAAQIPQDLTLLSGNSAALTPIVEKTPWLAKLGPELQQFVKSVATAPGYTLSKTAISEGRLPTAEEYGKDLAFFGTAPLGGKMAETAIGKLLPQTPKVITGALKGAAEGATGLTSTIPLMNDEEKKNVIQQYGPTALSMALMSAGHGLQADLSKLNLKTNQQSKLVNTETYQGPDRRTNGYLRQVMDKMSPEEMQQALFTHQRTGMLNKAAFETVLNTPELRKPVITKYDADSLKWWNDNLGEKSGDQLLKTIAEAFKKSGHGDNSFHTGGDEFYAQFDSPEAANKINSQIENMLQNAIIEVKNPDGTVRRFKGGVGLSYGYGETPETADAAMQQNKAAREQAGIRASRGNQPPGLVELTNGTGNDPTGSANQSNITEVKQPTLNEVKPLSQNDIAVNAKKEPWQMTREEYRKDFMSKHGQDPALYKTDRHLAIIENAFKEGKPIPAEVLKDYPNLNNNGRNFTPNVELTPKLQGEILAETQNNFNQIASKEVSSQTNQTRNVSQAQNLSKNMGRDLRIKNNADMGGYNLNEVYNYQIGGPNTPSVANASPAGFPSANPGSRSPIELPELVELVKSINDGKVPLVKAKLGNALGQFSTGKQNIKLRADIFKDPKVATRVLAHEIGHLADYLPDKTMSRGNILGRIASLRNYMKSDLPFTGIQKMEIMKELRDLSMKWKPFNPTQNSKYTAYRFSSKELYADAVSVLFNEPQLLEQEAPKFTKAFFDLLGQKPEVKKVYDEIQNRLTNPDEIGQNRLEGAYQMMKDTNKLRDEARKRLEDKPLSIVDTISKYLVDRDHPILKQIRSGEKQGGNLKDLAQKARWQIEETKYLASEAGQYMKDVSEAILKPIQEAGLNVEDVGVYMLAKRAATERNTLANPRGLDEEAAKRMLKDLEVKLGPDKFSKLEQGIKDYRKVHEYVIDQAEKSGIYSPELIKVMKDNKNYAKFSVAHYLEGKFGSGESARVYQQVGTLSDIENPFIATTLQDISVLRAAKVNQAKRAAVDFLKEVGGATQAEESFNPNLGFKTAKNPADPRQEILSYMDNGEIKSYYVDREIVNTFKRNPVEANMVVKVISSLTNPIKQVLVSKNPIWMARNVIKDLKTTVKNIPEVRLRDVLKLIGYYNNAYREVYNEVFKGKESADIKAMRQNYMLNPDRIYSGKDVSYENEIERLASEWQVNPEQNKQYEGVKGKLKQAWDFLDKLGKLSETTGKLAGYKYMTSETNLSQQEIGHIVRSRIGTPDARRQGELHQITNNLYMFSNIGKEGLRSMAESYNKNPGAYIWKTFMINVLPKLALVGASYAGSQALKNIINKIPEYDKQNYDVVPLGLTKEGKAIYLRIPQDYEGQTWSAITWALTHGKITGNQGAINALERNNPYSLNPVVQAGIDLYTYYVKGQNPIDEYRGNPIIPQKQFTVGGLPATGELLKHEWKSIGGATLYNPGDYSDRNEAEIEKILKMPGLNVLGSFLRFSDKGEQEQYYESQDKERQLKAQQSINIENRIIDSVKSSKRIPQLSDIANLYQSMRSKNQISQTETFGEFKNRYIHYAAKAIPDEKLRMIIKAPKHERMGLLQNYKKSMSQLGFLQLTNDLQKLGIDF